MMMSLREQAFGIAFDRLGSGESMLPFVLVSRMDGQLECTTIVTDRSDKAAYLGRSLVRHGAASTNAYAIVTDAYVRRSGERLDAILVEAAERGDSSASVRARAYARAQHGPASPVGTPIDLGKRPSEFEPWDPFLFDWGAITPDVYDDGRKIAVHAVNHYLESEDNVRRTLRFVRARIRHHAQRLPPGSTQVVHVDDRGQTVSPDMRALIRAADLAQVAFTTEMGK